LILSNGLFGKDFLKYPFLARSCIIALVFILPEASPYAMVATGTPAVPTLLKREGNKDLNVETIEAPIPAPAPASAPVVNALPPDPNIF
jgi:hypothetical protein